jgi:hypothetical protein
MVRAVMRFSVRKNGLKRLKIRVDISKNAKSHGAS